MLLSISTFPQIFDRNVRSQFLFSSDQMFTLDQIRSQLTVCPNCREFLVIATLPLPPCILASECFLCIFPIHASYLCCSTFEWLLPKLFAENAKEYIQHKWEESKDENIWTNAREYLVGLWGRSGNKVGEFWHTCKEKRLHNFYSSSCPFTMNAGGHLAEM